MHCPCYLFLIVLLCPYLISSGIDFTNMRAQFCPIHNLVLVNSDVSSIILSCGASSLAFEQKELRYYIVVLDFFLYDQLQLAEKISFFFICTFFFLFFLFADVVPSHHYLVNFFIPMFTLFVI